MCLEVPRAERAAAAVHVPRVQAAGFSEAKEHRWQLHKDARMKQIQAVREEDRYRREKEERELEARLAAEERELAMHCELAQQQDETHQVVQRLEQRFIESTLAGGGHAPSVADGAAAPSAPGASAPR